MVHLAAVVLVLGLAYPWLRGSWIVATMLTLPVALFALLSLHDHAALTLLALIVAALVWVPFACWRTFGVERQPAATPYRALVGIEMKR